MTFQVFVSSSFINLRTERDALQRDASARLHEYWQKHNCRFQAIDPRFRFRLGCGGQRDVTEDQDSKLG